MLLCLSTNEAKPLKTILLQLLPPNRLPIPSASPGTRANLSEPSRHCGRATSGRSGRSSGQRARRGIWSSSI